jgi:hypothetical protein
MKHALRIALAAGTAVLAIMWTLAALGTWWLLQAGAFALEAQPTAVSLQAVMAWTERPWVRYWLDPHEAEALRDGVGWLLGLDGGPAAWLGSALTMLGAALLLVWAGGLLFGAAGLLAAWVVTRWTLALWHSGSRRRWVSGQGTPTSGGAQSAI